MGKLDKANVQFIQTPGGDLAVLPRRDYDRLRALADDVVDARIIRASQKAIKEGREILLPESVVTQLGDGENIVRLLRQWRNMIQADLAGTVGISQNYLSDIETGKRKGPAELQKKFAKALRVPLDLLIG